MNQNKIMIALIEITIEPPFECTEQEFKKWVLFKTGINPNMGLDNPLNGYDMVIDDCDYKLKIMDK